MKKFLLFGLLISLFIVVPYAASDKEMFNDAFEHWSNRRYEDCLEVCQRFLATFSESEFMDDVLFLQGKCFYYLWDKENALKKEEHVYKIEDAVNSFQKLVDEFPDSELCPMSLMWIGNCYYFNKEYNNAISSYVKLIQDFQNHTEAKNARYRIAKSYEAKGNLLLALQNYKLVVKDYPDTPIAKQAEKDIQRIEKLLQD